MKEAGLTVGGFYKHSIRVTTWLPKRLVLPRTWERQVDAPQSRPAADYAKLIDDYLNEAASRHPGTAVLQRSGGEISRSD